jgi:hypothetical protein
MLKVTYTRARTRIVIGIERCSYVYARYTLTHLRAPVGVHALSLQAWKLLGSIRV